MPTVPTLNRQVASAPLRGGEIRSNANLETFGGGQIADDIQSGLGAISEGARDAVNEVNESASREKENEFKEKKTQHEIKLRSLKGKEVAANAAKLQEEFDKDVAELKEGLGNEFQKRIFDENTAKDRARFKRDSQIHESQEFEKFQDEQETTAIDLARESGTNNFSDPGAIADSLAAQDASVGKLGKMRGKSSDWVKLRSLEARSKTHLGIMNQRVVSSADVAAREYFEANKSDMTSEDRLKAKGLVEKGTLVGTSQRKADEIMANTKGSRQQLAEARAIKDPKTRDETVRRVKHRQSENRDLDVQDSKANLTNLYDQYSVDPAEFNPRDPRVLQLDTGDQAFLVNAMTKKRNATKTDPATYQKLMKMDPAKFATFNLMAPMSEGLLSTSDFKQFVKMQSSEEDYTNTQTLNTFINTALDGVPSLDLDGEGRYRKVFFEELNNLPAPERKSEESWNKIKDKMNLEIANSGWSGSNIYNRPYWEVKAADEKVPGLAKRPEGVPENAKFKMNVTDKNGIKRSGYFLRRNSDGAIVHYDLLGRKSISVPKKKRVDDATAKQ